MVGYSNIIYNKPFIRILKYTKTIFIKSIELDRYKENLKFKLRIWAAECAPYKMPFQNETNIKTEINFRSWHPALEPDGTQFGVLKPE